MTKATFPGNAGDDETTRLITAHLAVPNAVTRPVAFFHTNRAFSSKYEADLSGSGFEVDYVSGSARAIDHFTRQKEYGVIAMPLDIDPGESDDSVIREVVQMGEEAYWRVGLRIIELVRAEGSINRRTPIAVLTTYGATRELDETGDSIQRKCLDIGANEYMQVGEAACCH